jgi:transcriptional regulator with XRE-family HTH domain
MTWQDIGERIKAIRLNNNLTQEEFGELIGISRQRVGRIESGHTVSLEQIAVICQKTGVTLDYLVFGIVDPLADKNFLNDFTKEQIAISLDVLKGVANFIKAKNGNELLIKELMRRQ